MKYPPWNVPRLLVPSSDWLTILLFECGPVNHLGTCWLSMPSPSMCYSGPKESHLEFCSFPPRPLVTHLLVPPPNHILNLFTSLLASAKTLAHPQSSSARLLKKLPNSSILFNSTCLPPSPNNFPIRLAGRAFKIPDHTTAFWKNFQHFPIGFRIRVQTPYVAQVVRCLLMSLVSTPLFSPGPRWC